MSWCKVPKPTKPRTAKFMLNRGVFLEYGEAWAGGGRGESGIVGLLSASGPVFVHTSMRTVTHL